MPQRKYDQRGLAHIALAAIIVVVVAVIGFAAWKVSSNKSTSGGTKPTVNKQAEDACVKEINDKNFCKFAASFTLTTAYKAVVTSVDTSGTTVTNMSVDAKNNSTMTTSQDGKETGAFVSLNGDTYSKDEASGTWTRYPANNTSKPDTTNPTSDIKINDNNITENNTVTYKYIGKEKVGNTNSFKYQVVDTQTPNTTQYIWFDDKNYQMQRWYSKDANGSTDMVFTYQSVNITAPSPSKDFSVSNSTDLNAAAAAAAAALGSGSADTAQ